MKISKIKPGCCVVGCYRKHSPYLHPEDNNLNLCNRHIDEYLTVMMSRGFSFKPKPQEQAIKPKHISEWVWILINDDELSFPEKVARLNNEPKYEHLTVGNYL